MPMHGWLISEEMWPGRSRTYGGDQVEIAGVGEFIEIDEANSIRLWRVDLPKLITGSSLAGCLGAYPNRLPQSLTERLMGKLFNTCRLLYLAYFSKPLGDRLIYRAMIRGRAKTVLEIGIGNGVRACRLIETMRR